MARASREPPAAALIIAGGRGTRFWPASRERRPKPLFAADGRTTLLAATVRRLDGLIPRERVLVVADAAHAASFRRALRRILPPRNLLLEPAGRGTAAAIAFGAGVIRRRFGESTIAVFPADHFIEPASAFRRTIARAIALARERDALVVIGIPPTRAETGYGYQVLGARAGRGYRVARFIEKPARRAAERLVRSRRALWNAGIFVMTTAALEAEMRAHAPKLARAARRFERTSPHNLATLYRRFAFDSFDREVVEKSPEVFTVKAAFRWHDVGSWQGLWEALRGGRRNVLSGNVLALQSDGVIARAGKRLVVLFGLRDAVVVDAGDALLVASRERAQDLRRVPAELARRGLRRYL